MPSKKSCLDCLVQEKEMRTLFSEKAHLSAKNGVITLIGDNMVSRFFNMAELGLAIRSQRRI